MDRRRNFCLCQLRSDGRPDGTHFSRRHSRRSSGTLEGVHATRPDGLPVSGADRRGRRGWTDLRLHIQPQPFRSLRRRGMEMIAAGSKLGPYEILAPLGAGGMGEVYRARDTRLLRDVAIKVLPPHLADTPDARARFEREAKAISSLNHPHICTLFDVGREGAQDYLVMELVEGETLA